MSKLFGHQKNSWNKMELLMWLASERFRTKDRLGGGLDVWHQREDVESIKLRWRDRMMNSIRPHIQLQQTIQQGTQKESIPLSIYHLRYTPWLHQLVDFSLVR